MLENINEVILSHMKNGNGAAAYLRGMIPNIDNDIEKLFSARSDIKRIQLAEKLAEKILNLTDFSDLIPLRDEVASLEIKRLIDYEKQTDHTAHTVYLFLLGIWIYDNNSILRGKIDQYISSNKPAKMFIFQWTFASLLHDVGYLFFNFNDGKNQESWDKFDEMFSVEYIPNYIGERVEKHKDDLVSLLEEFIKSHSNSLIHSNQNDTIKLLEQLDTIPWMEELIGRKSSGLDILLAPWDNDRKVVEFSKKISEKGYDKKGGDPKADQAIHPQVDHAIASGLMLLKYTSVWYWIYKKAKQENEDLSNELVGKFNYPIEVFEKYVIPACRAIAYHNITDKKFNCDNDPLLYLAVLCDELQLWDRFWVGDEYINDWKNAQHYMAEDIFAGVINNESYVEQINILLPKDRCDKLVKTLSDRLENYNDYVKLTSLV